MSAGSPLRCAFCGRRKHETDRFVAGPGVCICQACIAVATEALVLNAEPRWPPGEPPAPGRRKWPAKTTCSFCGRASDEVAGLVKGPAAQVCTDCLELCNRIAISRSQPSGRA